MSGVAVIIPACDETSVIGPCLTAMLAGPGATLGLEIVVVCNGCQDDTAAQARRVAGVRVVETVVASKSAALNMGEHALEHKTGVRFYVDADVILSAAAMAEVVAVMGRTPGVLAASPMIRFDLQNCNWFVRAFYEVWGALPYCRVAMIGSGVYALSAEGRKRFGEFPDITADDAFVRLHFKPEERLTVESCYFTVRPPTTLRGVIKIKARAFFGDLELAAGFPELLINKRDEHGRALSKLSANPRWWVMLLVYFYARTLSRCFGYWRFHFGNHTAWERDETSRAAAVLRNATGH